MKQAGVTLMVGYHKRYDPGYLHARQQVLGMKDLRMVRVDVLHPVDARARDHYHLLPVQDQAQAELADDEATDGLDAYVLEGPPRRAIGRANHPRLVGRPHHEVRQHASHGQHHHQDAPCHQQYLLLQPHQILLPGLMQGTIHTPRTDRKGEADREPVPRCSTRVALYGLSLTCAADRRPG